MLHQERMDQLAYSAGMHYTTPIDDQGWKERLKVEKGQSGLMNEVKYHFKMCFDLAMHLTIAEEESPVWTTLNYLFNFALLELRLAEFKYLYHLLQFQLVGFDMAEKDLLFVTAQSFYRVRETLWTQHRRLTLFKQNPRLFEVSDQPFRHHTAKQLGKNIFLTIEFLSQQLEKGLLVFKQGQDQVESDFWESLASQLGFTIHMLNRVVVLTPCVDSIDQ